MDINQKNKLCAIKRWKRIHSKESARINHNWRLIARLCGFLAGDGSVKIRREKNGKLHHVLEFFPDDSSLVNPFIEAIQIVYGKTPTINNHGSHYRLRLNSKVVVEDLTQITDFGINDWSVPENILKSEETKVEWIRAFFDSEAYVGKSHIKVQSVNRFGIEQVKKLLESLGIKVSYTNYIPKKQNWNKVYILLICKREERLKFLKIIGFNHQKKNDKLFTQFANMPRSHNPVVRTQENPSRIYG